MKESKKESIKKEIEKKKEIAKGQKLIYKNDSNKGLSK